MTDPHVLDPSCLPTPFTAQEIRANSPAGRTVRTLVETPDDPPVHEVSRFVEVDAHGAHLENWTEKADGTRTPAERYYATWRTLQEHALFPTDATRVERVMLATQLGELLCTRYTVTRDDGRVSRFWFDTGRPGMPVAHDHTDASGRTALAVSMVSDEVVVG
ncbi:hypothetical protein Q6348_02445 [Isoptericola sp. b441]|uniref:Uncharacterized protein n=1 Tax=Actinotalea lenta TaxID=3064654 RepID=A0ABT9D5I6_9CELL|nr:MULTISPECIES: hypothetical protein [unclassified Isoptericola]MDO8106052.1 hypothetical protein [Isoptericola sp. b441]MDO8122229.1 hypothetical protein [Isoptericola sp. b490]